MILQGICPNCFSNSFSGNYCLGCGYSQNQPREVRALPVGTVLFQRFIVGRILGIGGFGITYLAWDRYGQRVCAVKEYFPQDWAMRIPASLELRARDGRYEAPYLHSRDNFINEAKILHEFEENPSIVDIVAFFQENNTAYIAMEYVQGETLTQNMKRRKKTMSVRQTQQSLCQVALALGMLHSAGLLHRDVSPDNIMLTDSGMVKLIDFGAARQYIMNRTTDMSVLLKPGFAPIEQYYKVGRHGPWIDVYALAATYYYLITGKKPVPSTDRNMGEKMMSAHEVQPKISKALSKVLDHAMEMDYTKRIQSMEEFVRELRQALGTGKDVPYIWMRMNGNVRRWKFHVDSQVRIGRSQAECDIYLPAPNISHIHCVVRYDADNHNFVVEDCSKNGTYTRRGRIGRGKHTVLYPGEVFYVISKEYEFGLEVR